MSKQTQQVDAIKLDKNMSIPQVKNDQMTWLSPLEGPFHIAGFPWLKQDHTYRRLPVSPVVPLPSAVDKLANCTAGGQIRFRTNTSKLAIKVKLSAPADMYNMTAIAQCGFDCYLGEPGNQQFLNTTKFAPTTLEYESTLYDWKEKREYAVTLNFPLYQGVEEVWIGVDDDATVSEAAQYASDKPIVIYGTSITQGGCATRPGLAYTNILSRSIPLEFINLGFSGNGKGEPEVATVIAGIEKASLFVLDYEANTGAAENIAASLPAFINIIREQHPLVPILVISRIKYSCDYFYPELHQASLHRKQAQIDVVERLRNAGDQHLHFLDGSPMLGTEGASEGTIDGSHPTDYGFLTMARYIEPVIKALL